MCSLLSFGALASDDNSDSERAIKEKCRSTMNTARVVMQARQYGVPLSQELELLDSVKHDEVKDLFEVLILEAYSKDRELIEEFQENAINEFETNIYFRCLQAFD